MTKHANSRLAYDKDAGDFQFQQRMDALMANGPSHQQEQAERKAMLANERKLRLLFNEAGVRNEQRKANEEKNTYHAHTHDEAGGRFAVDQWSKSQIVGTTQTPTYNTAPNWSADAVGQEPLIDARDCGDQFGVALGEAHENEGDDSGPAPSAGVAGGGTEHQPNEAGVSVPSANHAADDPPRIGGATEGEGKAYPPSYSNAASTLGLVVDAADGDRPLASSLAGGEGAGGEAVGDTLSQSSRPTIRRRMI